MFLTRKAEAQRNLGLFVFAIFSDGVVVAH